MNIRRDLNLILIFAERNIGLCPRGAPFDSNDDSCISDSERKLESFELFEETSQPCFQHRCNKCKHLLLNLSLKIIRVVIQNITTFWILNVDRNLPACSSKQRYKFFFFFSFNKSLDSILDDCHLDTKSASREQEERGNGIYKISGENFQNKKGRREKEKWKSRECEDSFYFRAFSRAFARSFSRVARWNTKLVIARRREIEFSVRDKWLSFLPRRREVKSLTERSRIERWRVSYSRYTISCFPFSLSSPSLEIGCLGFALIEKFLLCEKW